MKGGKPHGKVYFSKSHFMSDKKKRDEETKRHEKAAALRKYAKLCEREGIASSRVNVKNVPRPEKEEEYVKPAKVKKVSEAHVVENKGESHEDRERKIKEALAKRNEKRKLMNQKTRKGQPVMKNQITSILGKLMKEHQG